MVAAQIHRRSLEGAVGSRQPGRDEEVHDGSDEGDVPERDRRERKRDADPVEEQCEREPGEHAGDDEREQKQCCNRS